MPPKQMIRPPTRGYTFLVTLLMAALCYLVTQEVNQSLQYPSLTHKSGVVMDDPTPHKTLFSATVLDEDPGAFEKSRDFVLAGDIYAKNTAYCDLST